MIKIEKDFNQPPATLASEACRAKVKQAIEEQQGHSFSSDYYRAVDVCEALTTLYAGKCAYCEGSVLVYYEIEHYRPKKAGYYWLGYAWSNLLIACRHCNGRKGTQFPLEPDGKHIAFTGDPADDLQADCFRADKGLLQAEKPLLLNPEIDDPNDHLAFRPDGSIHGKTWRGKETIRICGLDTDGMKKERKKIKDALVVRINRATDEFRAEKTSNEAYLIRLRDVFHDLTAAGEKAHAYSCFGKTSAQQFSDFFLEGMATERRKTILEAYRRFKKKFLKEPS